jgi:hypothetical protein
VTYLFGNLSTRAKKYKEQNFDFFVVGSKIMRAEWAGKKYFLEFSHKMKLFDLRPP